MGINRIRLQDGATGDPRVDARMQQTYQENIAANEAQRQANEIALAAATSTDTAMEPYDAENTTYTAFTPTLEVASPRTVTPEESPLTVMPSPQYMDPLPQDELMSGFEEYIRNNPDAMSGIGTSAMMPVTLPGGYEYDFSGSTEATAFNKYLDSIGQAPYTRRQSPMDMTGPMFTGFDYSQPTNWSPGKAAPEGYRVVNMMGDQFLERIYPSKEEIGGLPMGPMGPMGMPGMMPPMMNDPYEGLSGQEYAEKYGIPYASGGRVGFQAGSPAEMAKAQAAAAQDPALDRIRQQLFGQDYISDIGEGGGIAQYYSGFGLPSSLQFTQPGEEVTPVVNVTQPVVDTGGGGGGGDGGVTGITSASVVQPTSDPFLASGAAGGARLPKITDQAGAIAAMTQDPAYSLPGQSDPFLASGAAGGARLPATQATTTLPSGDIFATDDPLLAEKMDYTEQQDPTFLEKARDDFLATGRDINNLFTGLKDKGIDIAKMTGSAILNFMQPGLGFIMQAIPQETPIDKFNREYAIGGDLYQNVVAQSGDPKFEGRLQNYSSDLSAGNIGGKDPFGKNVVSLMGDYPAYATETYNEIVAKEKAGKELSQFDKDRKEYYGHVSGLTGKTNIPGTPLMVDDSPFKTFPEGTPEDVTILPKDKPIIEEDAIKTIDTIAGNTIYGNEKIGFYPSAAEAQDALEAFALPTTEGPPSILNPYDPKTLASEDLNRMEDYYDVDISQDASDAPGITGTPVTGIEGPPSILSPEVYQDPIMDMAAEQAAAEAAAAQAAAAAAQRAVDRNRGDGEGPRNIDTGPDYSNVSTAGQAGPPSQRGGNGGNGGGGGKIVCTMMNNSYGFGSFRNKIWLRHSKDLAPEYQIGYHKIFLPLVRLSKTNKLLKKTLEHIAVHRTIDIRQEARGKVHLLGRVYRKILEPICYMVGKYAKR